MEKDEELAIAICNIMIEKELSFKDFINASDIVREKFYNDAKLGVK